MHRGSRHQRIFEDDGDRREFLARLAEMPSRHGIRLHAYALMSNHYHVLVECPDGGISNAMKDLNSGYAQWFNWRHSYDGHLFRGRFRSILIGDDSYLVEVARYIHRNSVQAGTVARPVEDPWSSHLSYVTGSTRRWLHTDRVLSYFAGDRQRFAAFVDARDSIKARAVLEAIDSRRVAVGSRSFLTRLAGATGHAHPPSCTTGRLIPFDVMNLAERPASNARTKAALMAAARRQGASYRAIADAFEVSQASTVRSSVCRIERRAKADPAVEQEIAEATRPSEG